MLIAELVTMRDGTHAREREPNPARLAEVTPLPDSAGE